MHPTSCSAKTVEKQRNSILFPFFLPYFCKEFLLQNELYFENTFCVFPYPVFPNLCDAHLSVQRRRWAGDVALGVQHQQCRAKCLGTRTGCLVLLATISLPVNVIPFPGLKTLLAIPMHTLHLYARMTCLVAAEESNTYQVMICLDMSCL